MIGRFCGTILITGTASIAGVVTAQQGREPPELTPEQEAEMATYQNAGAPGEPHKAIAATAGKYTIKTKSWSEPGGRAMENMAP